MGYTTSFAGKLEFDNILSPAQVKEINDFSQERHGGNTEVFDEFPGFWCQWVVTEDGKFLEWDEGEKFYEYIEWLEYLINKFFIPWGVKLNGEIDWFGEDHEDMGKIKVEDNNVKILYAHIQYKEE